MTNVTRREFISESAMMDKPMNNVMFKGMCLIFMIRDFFRPRGNILKEVEIKPGDHVLDYGCGPGGYVLPTSELVGNSGKTYALDINPLAVKRVEKIASKNQLANVETTCSDCKTGLQDDSLDVVLLYDIFHMLSDPNGVLKELHRVLKPNGILSFSDHHMKENEIMPKITGEGLFGLSKKGERTYSFLKQG
jgi:ubiquinone/menaquinone biosynthesis C-methylase UbiE